MKTINLSVADKTYLKLSKAAEDFDMQIGEFCAGILRQHQYGKQTPDRQPTDEEIEEALKSSKALNPFLFIKYDAFFLCPKCGGRLTTIEVYRAFGIRLRHTCYDCNIEWDHFLTMGKVLK